ncbi:MAG TPA: AAA family ATPase, partial [Geobacteraceae bacterium]
MYLDFYGFSENPFSLSPNPRFIFFSKTHKEAFALLLYGINNRFGFIELSGEVGTGKTTVLRTLLSQLDEERYRTALIFNPSATAVDLMRAINHEFGIPCESDNVAELLGELNLFLLEENAAGRIVALIIDEAQNLPPALLEQIRLISNLETDTEKLIQIVLAGQPELGTLLERPELRQINQRIALRYNLHSLDREDARAYIRHRITMAGGGDRVAFTMGCFAWLYRYSRGTPRLINILCDRALLIAYTEDQRRVTARIMALAFRDVMLKPALGGLLKFRREAVQAVVAA